MEMPSFHWWSQLFFFLDNLIFESFNLVQQEWQLNCHSCKNVNRHASETKEDRSRNKIEDFPENCLSLPNNFVIKDILQKCL